MECQNAGGEGSGVSEDRLACGRPVPRGRAAAVSVTKFSGASGDGVPPRETWTFAPEVSGFLRQLYADFEHPVDVGGLDGVRGYPASSISNTIDY
jgi:hypothetical protein